MDYNYRGICSKDIVVCYYLTVVSVSDWSAFLMVT